jgi:hemerythrin
MSEDAPADLHTGIAEMDAEHAQQARTVQAIENAIRRGGEGEAIRSLLLGLLDDTREHFEAEQALMERSSYPGYEAHKAAHDRLLGELRRIEARHRSEGVSEGSIGELKTWLFEHIRHMDKALGHFLETRAKAGEPAS